jgi:transposase InsO family protein
MYTKNPNMPRVRLQAVELKRKGWSARKIGRYLGFHHTAVMKWVRKGERLGYHPIATESSRPKHHPRELKENVIKEIVETRLEIKRSAEVIHKVLEEKNIKVSLSSVKRTLDRRGLLKKRSPWKRLHFSIKRPMVAKPGDLVQVDTVHLMTEKGRIYVFTLIDVYSRWTYARSYERCNTKSAIDFLRGARVEATFPFNCIQSDNGSEFSQHFTERIKILHRHSRVRRPNDNAHLERFNRTIQEECLDYLKPNVDIINKALPKYLHYYNTERHHFGLNLKKPIEMVPSY